MKITACPIADLSPATLSSMFTLLQQHFLYAEYALFTADLENKNWCLTLEDDNRVVGFSTFAVYASPAGIVDDPVLCSGDTIVDPAVRGSTHFLAAWIHTVTRLRREYGTPRFHWLLIVSGFRTYRLLPVFWRTFYPRHDCAAPAQVQRTMNQLAGERFGAQFNAQHGVVRLPIPQVLRHACDRDPQSRKADPHIEFFQRTNPGHDRGDELVTLSELSDANLTAAGRRVAARPTTVVFPEMIS